jgi:hypothetical protein
MWHIARDYGRRDASLGGVVRRILVRVRVLPKWLNLKVLFITGYADNAVSGHGLLSDGLYIMTKLF